MTEPMSGGDAASRGHLNAEKGSKCRGASRCDIDALAPEHPASPGDMRVQRNRVAPSPIGGSTEADAAEVGGRTTTITVSHRPRFGFEVGSTAQNSRTRERYRILEWLDDCTARIEVLP